MSYLLYSFKNINENKMTKIGIKNVVKDTKTTGTSFKISNFIIGPVKSIISCHFSNTFLINVLRFLNTNGKRKKKQKHLHNSQTQGFLFQELMNIFSPKQ